MFPLYWYIFYFMHLKALFSTNLWLPGGKEYGKEIVREFRIDMYTLLYLKWITNKDLLYSTWNSTQCYAAAWMGGELGRE